MESNEKLYSELLNDGRVKKKNLNTSAMYIFNGNIAVALMLPTLVYGPDSDSGWSFKDSFFLKQASIVQIITSLEAYYQDTFEIITKNLTTSEIDAVALSRFLKENRLLTEFTEALQKQKTLHFHVSEIVPKFYPFQDKEKIKLALNLVGLDPIGPYDKEWANTFGDNEDSTVNLRHAFVHRGCFTNLLGYLNGSFVISRIKDAMVLANFVNDQIIGRFQVAKFKELYPRLVEKR